MQQDVYELLTAKPHDPPNQRLTMEQWDVYRIGYDYALVIALRVMQAAAVAFGLQQQESRQRARQAAPSRRRGNGRHAMLIGRECSWWCTDRGDFCRELAHWMRVDTAGRPMSLRCDAHRAPGCRLIPIEQQEADSGPGYWLSQRLERDVITRHPRSFRR